MTKSNDKQMKSNELTIVATKLEIIINVGSDRDEGI